MKTNWVILFLLVVIFFDYNIRPSYSVNREVFLVKDSLGRQKISLDSISDDSVARLDITDSVKIDSLEEEIHLISSDSLLYMLSDTICADSIFTKDSLLLDTVPVPFLDTISICLDSVKLDSLNMDTIVRLDSTANLDTIAKPDTVENKNKILKKSPKKIVPQSVKDLQYIYYRYKRNQMEDQDRWDDIYLSLSEIEMKPIFYKYVIPLTYYSKPFIEASSIDGWYPKDILKEDSISKANRIMKDVPRVDNDVLVSKKIDRQMLDFYTHYPELVRLNESKIDSLEVICFDTLHYSSENSGFINMAQNNIGLEVVEESDLLVYKPNFWTSGGSGFLQFSQNYISDNWYKGGESSKSLLSGINWQVKYDNKQNFQYEGKLEWKLGFISAPSDTVHSYKPNNDLLRLSSKLGYRAIWDWYYTLSAEFQTQLFSNYATNSDKLISTILSPATLNIGVGVDYKLVKDGVIDLSVLLNPFNYTMYSVASDKVDPTKFNIKEGHKVEHELGSRINTTLTWKMFSFLMWKSKFTYTTNYEKVFSEWENTFTFVINKYLSTNLFLHARYDDGAKPKKGDKYLQFQEILSFGLNYTW